MRRRQFLSASFGMTVAGSAAVPVVKQTAGAEERPSSLGEVTGDTEAAADWESNEVIQGARQVALDILRPSKKDLEHGLELHADSLVFDIYGFAPRAAVDGDSIRRAVEMGASAIEVKDIKSPF